MAVPKKKRYVTVVYSQTAPVIEGPVGTARRHIFFLENRPALLAQPVSSQVPAESSLTWAPRLLHISRTSFVITSTLAQAATTFEQELALLDLQPILDED